MKKDEVYELIVRYAILILLGLFQLKIFYMIFTPLTVYPIYWVISLLGDNAVLLKGNVLFFSGLPDYIEIIPACVAGAAYYLLVILNLTTPMELGKRVKSLGFLLLIFLVLNITRILVFLGILLFGYQYFDLTHVFVWYFGSTVMVVLIWFLNVWLFKIKPIPIYSDFKRIFGDVVGKEKKKKRR